MPDVDAVVERDIVITAPIRLLADHAERYLQVCGELPDLPPFWGLWAASAAPTPQRLVDGLFSWGSSFEEAAPYLSVDASRLREVRGWELGEVPTLRTPVPVGATVRPVQPFRPPTLLAASPAGALRHHLTRLRSRIAG